MREKRNNLVICLLLMLFLVLNANTLDNKQTPANPVAKAEEEVKEDNSSLQHDEKNDVKRKISSNEEVDNKGNQKVESDGKEDHKEENLVKQAQSLEEKKVSFKKTLKSTFKATKPKKAKEHFWNDWKYKDENEEVRICLKCGEVETRLHNYASNCTYSESEEDSKHLVKEAFKCSTCTAYYETSYEEPHNYKKITKIVESNKDGSHLWKTQFKCVCGENHIQVEEESCSYRITGYKKTGVNDTHLEQKICTICQYNTEEEGTCVPKGKLKLVKVYAQIYEYYDCELCGDWCQRKYHTVHQYEPWEYHDSQTHIRYCICVEARQEEEHSYQYKGAGTMTCKQCGATKTVSEHNHGYDIVDEMDLMDIIKSEAYKNGEILSNSQIYNPNPATDVWCTRYEFRCKTCGVKYYSYREHLWKDGKCTRSSCGIEKDNAIARILKKIAMSVQNKLVDSEEKGKEEETKPKKEGKEEETKPKEEGKEEETKPKEKGKEEETKAKEEGKEEETKPKEEGKEEETKPEEEGKEEEAKPEEGKEEETEPEEGKEEETEPEEGKEEETEPEEGKEEETKPEEDKKKEPTKPENSQKETQVKKEAIIKEDGKEEVAE